MTVAAAYAREDAGQPPALFPACRSTDLPEGARVTVFFDV